MTSLYCNFVSPLRLGAQQTAEAQRRPGLLDCALFLHIPPQREAPCFYMNEHGWVVRRLSGETGSICLTQERKLFFDTYGMQSSVHFCKKVGEKKKGVYSSCLKWRQMHSILSYARPQCKEKDLCVIPTLLIKHSREHERRDRWTDLA